MPNEGAALSIGILLGETGYPAINVIKLFSSSLIMPENKSEQEPTCKYYTGPRRLGGGGEQTL
jgi:hypothetical protein